MQKLFFIICFFLNHHVSAQTKGLENLVFEGAGIRGIAYSGAISALEQQNLLPGIKRVGGTSAGAITALMLSLNYKAAEVRAIISKTNFKDLNNGRFWIAGGLNRVQRYFGWYRGKRVEQWLGYLIEAKTGAADITFMQLKEAGFKDLYVTGTSLNKQQSIIFSHEHFPHMKVRDAVRISMSIPLYFEAVFIDSTGQIVHHPKNKSGLNIMVDGGFTANFPIRLFDSLKYFNTTVPNACAVNEKTLGFRIDSDGQVKMDSAGSGLASMPVTNLKEYATAFYTIILENLNRQTLTPNDWKRTVSISDGAIGPRIRKLSTTETSTLINNGHTATESYFTKQ